jgi:exonuclease SbcD
VEGATVGPADFMFRRAPDVIRVRDVPPDFAAVLSGHIHRHQVLTRDLRDCPLHTPVLYPGSIERTSSAEIGEPKGFMVLHVADGHVHWEFRQLPAREMIVKELVAYGLSPAALESAVRATVAAAPPDAVLTIRIGGALTDEHLRCMSAARLRTYVPQSMNLEIRAGDASQRSTYSIPRGSTRQPGLGRRSAGTNLQLELGGSSAG